jgi:hypothetical protein
MLRNWGFSVFISIYHRTLVIITQADYITINYIHAHLLALLYFVHLK